MYISEYGLPSLIFHQYTSQIDYIEGNMSRREFISYRGIMISARVYQMKSNKIQIKSKKTLRRGKNDFFRASAIYT